MNAKAKNSFSADMTQTKIPVSIFNTDGLIRGPDKYMYTIYQTERVLIEYHGLYS